MKLQFLIATALVVFVDNAVVAQQPATKPPAAGIRVHVSP